MLDGASGIMNTGAGAMGKGFEAAGPMIAANPLVTGICAMATAGITYIGYQGSQ
jgi:hypothetical protein